MTEAEAVIEALTGIRCDDTTCPGECYNTGRSLASMGKDLNFDWAAADDDTMLWQCRVCGKGQWLDRATRLSVGHGELVARKSGWGLILRSIEKP